VARGFTCNLSGDIAYVYSDEGFLATAKKYNVYFNRPYVISEKSEDFRLMKGWMKRL